MATIDELLAPITVIGLQLIGGQVPQTPVSEVVVIESLEAIADTTIGSLIVLTPTCTSRSASYEFDIAVRQAAAIGVSGLLFVSPVSLSPTTTRLAERSQLALLGCAPDTTVAQLVVTLDQLTRGDSGTLIARAMAALEQVQDLSPRAELDDILRHVSSHLGTDVRMADYGERVYVNGHTRYHIAAAVDDDATRLALPGVAAALSRWQAMIDAERHAPEQARTEVLSELLIREDASVNAQMIERLRASGLLLDATHTAVCISHERAGMAVDIDLLTRRVERERIRTLASSLLPIHDGWSVAIVEEDIILVRSLTRDLTDRAQQASLKAFLHELHTEDPSTTLYFGCGTAQPGLSGLQQSARESRIAAGSAATKGIAWVLEAFDSTGVNRLLAQLGSSWAGRRIISEILAPLDHLGVDRASTQLETLNAYLDARGSLIEAGRTLHLHPNAVSYRLRRLKEQTGWDLDDPDLRFALQVACRVRLMTPQTSTA